MNARWFAAFSFLLLAVHEAHELAHAVTARALCGAWPVRDFNSWTAPCDSWVPTAAGPLFSYALMFAGAVLLRNRAAGAALILAANPFARIFTAMMGGGDEMVVAQRLFSSERTLGLRLAVLTFVVIVCGAALVAAFRAMRSAWWFSFAMVWPMVLTGLALFVVGNRLLHAGVFSDVGPGGAPLLVTIVSLAAAVLSLLTLRWLTNTSNSNEAGSQTPMPGAMPSASNASKAVAP